MDMKLLALLTSALDGGEVSGSFMLQPLSLRIKVPLVFIRVVTE
jgi:hypothetical protein